MTSPDFAAECARRVEEFVDNARVARRYGDERSAKEHDTIAHALRLASSTTVEGIAGVLSEIYGHHTGCQKVGFPCDCRSQQAERIVAYLEGR